MAEYINKDKLYQTESLLDSDIIKQDKIASYLLSQILYDIKHFPKQMLHQYGVEDGLST